MSRFALALTGGTASGKSVIARRLAEASGFPVRYCGEEVKELARQLGVAFGNLDDASHRAVDQATRVFATQEGSIILEGRFLRFVLAQCEVESLSIVELHADAEERRRRLEMRTRRPTTLKAIEDSDLSDVAFAERLYADVSPLSVINLDTTTQDIDKVVEAILRIRPLR